jgi:uncharacterized membrane protein
MNEKPFEQIMLLVAFCSVILLFFIPAFYLDELPTKLPSHFNGSGEADAYSDKSGIWFLPIVGLVLFIILEGLSRFSETHKVKLKPGQTLEQAEAQKLVGIEMMRALNGFFQVALVYIMWATVQTGLGNQQGLGSAFTTLFLLGTLGITFYYIFRMVNIKA